MKPDTLQLSSRESAFSQQLSLDIVESLKKAGALSSAVVDMHQADRDKVADAIAGHPSLELATDDPVVATLQKWSRSRDARANAGDIIRVSKDRVEVLTPEEAAMEHQLAEMGQGGLAGVAGQLDGALGVNIPWGAVLVGAVPGAIAGEIVDGLFSPRNDDGSISWTNIAVKAGVGFAAVQFLPNYIGKRQAQFFIGALVLQIFTDILPLDRIVDWAVEKLGSFRNADSGQRAIQEAEEVVRTASARNVSSAQAKIADKMFR